jgi:hypothetical protein
MLADLWSNIWQTSTAFRQKPGLPSVLQFEHGRQTEIGYFKGPSNIKQQIFRLQISMTDSLVVDVILWAFCRIGFMIGKWNIHTIPATSWLK